MKYYFVCYEYKRNGSNEWERSNVALKEHPVSWLKQMIIDYHRTCQYRLLFWEEIDKETFDEIDGWID